jgi:tetratricopeptide (TPR) repeat protein
VPSEPEPLNQTPPASLDKSPFVDSSNPTARPVIFIPVEAADVIQHRRRRWALIAGGVILVAALGAFIYKRSLDPIRAQDAYDAGVRLLKIARFPQAILNFDRATSLRPGFAEAYLMRGRAFVADNQTERGSRDFTTYIGMRPNDPIGFVERGQAYVEMRDFQSAITDASTAIEIAPNFARGYNLRGVAVRAMGNPAGALADFNRAVELAPIEINYFERAATYQLLDQHRLAIADLDELIHFKPEFASGYFARAKSRSAIGDRKGAAEDRKLGRSLDGR